MLRTRRLASLLPLLLAGATRASEEAKDWPQWRGPERDAVSTETGLAKEWPEGGPEILWRTEVGPGFSGIAAAGGRLYTMWDEGPEQVLVCLEAASGEVLWMQLLGQSYRNPWGDGPRSTPLVDGEAVYAVGTQGQLLAAAAESGELIWDVDLVEELGAALPTYGYACSPLVVGERLFVETAGRDAAYAAFDKESGRCLWKAQNDSPAYSSPMHVTLHGAEQILFWSASGVSAVTPDTGEELWRRAWRTDCAASGDPLGTGTPLFLPPDRFFLSSGSGTAVIRVARADEGWEVETCWESRDLRNDVNSSLLLDGHVYGFDFGTLKCLEAATGEVKWKTRGYRKGALIAADGRLIVLGETGDLALVDASPEAFNERSRASILSGRSWTTPALADGRLYLRNHKEMVCLALGG
jgi:outer membrane protein assembly factor BamB